MTYRVKNWERFQHYKNRNPPWIRLYVEVLDDYKADGTENDFHALPDNDKLTILLIWALASRYNGVIPSIDPAWLAVKLGIANPSTDAIIRAGFLIPVSHASADASADASNTLATQHGDCVPESETETETETETEGDARGRADRPDAAPAAPRTPPATATAAVKFNALPDWLRTAPGMDSGIWAAWIDTRRRKRAAVGSSAISLCIRKLEARKNEAGAYLALAVERGWQGVSWDWFDAARGQGQQPPTRRIGQGQALDAQEVTPEVARAQANRRQVAHAIMAAARAAGRRLSVQEIRATIAGRADLAALPADDIAAAINQVLNSLGWRAIRQQGATE